jgi:ABC-type antimicrobial peptide transport system permease subunit
MAVFSVSALLVASLSIYGILSYSVTRRQNEIRIRMALSAERLQLLALVIRQGMAPFVLGLIVKLHQSATRVRLSLIASSNARSAARS